MSEINEHAMARFIRFTVVKC